MWIEGFNSTDASSIDLHSLVHVIMHKPIEYRIWAILQVVTLPHPINATPPPPDPPLDLQVESLKF